MTGDKAMKGLVTAATLAMVFSAGAMAETWSTDRESDGQTQFWLKLEGEVKDRCRMVTDGDTTIQLDLNNKNSVSEFKFKAWCNNDMNSGLLVVGAKALRNENGIDTIPLDISYKGTNGRIDSDDNQHAIETNIHVHNKTGGSMGKTKVLEIKPDLNTFEKAGRYQTSMYVSLYPR